MSNYLVQIGETEAHRVHHMHRVPVLASFYSLPCHRCSQPNINDSKSFQAPTSLQGRIAGRWQNRDSTSNPPQLHSLPQALNEEMNEHGERRVPLFLSLQVFYPGLCQVTGPVP